MTSFKLSFLSRSCLLALTAGGSFAAFADSPWRALNGAHLDVTSGYSTSVAKDYPLYASGAGSDLETVTSGLTFSSTGNLIFAAYALQGATIELTDTALATNGSLAHGAVVDNSTLTMTGGSIAVQGDSSVGVVGRNGATASVDNVRITSSGFGGSGVQMDYGTLSLKNSTIVTSGSGNQGLNLGTSTAGSMTATLDNVDLILLGTGSGAGIALANGTVTGTDVNITVGDSLKGVNITNSSNAGSGMLTLNDSSISTQKGDGIYIMRGEVALNDTSVSTQSGNAINLNTTAKATINGGTFTTQGADALGMWIATADSSASVAGASFTTYGARAHAFDAQKGTATLTDTSLKTLGANSYALYTESEVQGENLTIDTQGTGGIGVFAALGGVMNLQNSSVATSGTGSTAVLSYPGSTVTGDNLQISVTGDSSRGLWTREGALNLSNSTVLVKGNASAGLYASNGGTGLGSQVLLDNVQLSTEAGPAVKTEGTGLALVLQNGTQMTSGSNVLLQDLVSDQGPGNVSITADNSVVLKGDLLAVSENQVDVALNNASQLTGAVQNVDSLTLDGSSVWTMTGNSTFGQFTHNGTVNFSHSGSDFSTLTVDTLEGDGAFAMNTDIAALTGDLINVTGQAHGNHLLYISNTGAEPASGNELTVVKTGGGDETFALHGGAVDVGTWQYTLREEGDDWVLVQKSKTVDPGSPGEGGGENPGEGDGNSGGETGGGVIDPVPTPTAVTAIGMFNATPTAWYGELTTLRTRMGEVRQGKHEGGAWVQMLGNKYSVSERAGTAYQQQQTGMSIGVDDTHDLEQGQLITGLFSGFSRSSLDFDHGSTGKIDSFFIGGYATWLLQDGWFVDAVAKANNFNSHADARMSSGEKASGGYSVPAFGLSLEAGRQLAVGSGWFVEPSVQISSLWVKGDDYTFDNELHAQSGSVTSKQAALNGVVGKTVELNNGVTLQPWLRAAVIQEFSDDNAVSINGNRFNNDMSGTRGEYGAGIAAQATKNLQVYADARYAKGDKIESPWGGNIGVRWSW